MLRLHRPLPLLVAALLLTACGGSVESKNSPKDGGHDWIVQPQDAGTDAPDAAPDAPAPPPSDAAPPDAPAPPPGDAAPEASPPAVVAGAACDGQNGDPNGCGSSALTCYTGQNNPNEQGRWPGGYCTARCRSDADCAAFDAVCGGGAFGGGRCEKKCTQQSDCRQGYACRNVGIGTTTLACAPTGFLETRDGGVACFQHTDPNQPFYAPPLKDTHFSAAEQVDNTSFSSDEIAFAQNSKNQLVVGANSITQAGYENPSMYATGTSLPLSFAKAGGPTYSAASYYSDPYIVAASDGTFYYSTLGLNQQATMAWLVVGHSTDGGQTWQAVKADPDSDCNGSLSGPNAGPCLDHPWLAIGPDITKQAKQAVYAAYLATRSSTSYPTVLIRSIDGGKTWGIPGSPGKSLAVFGGNGSTLYTNLITPTVDSTGVVHMVATVLGSNQEKGSTQNAIFYSRSTDGGKTRTTPADISKVGWPVPFEQAVIATDNAGQSIYVAYVTGAPDGDWDIVLAISNDEAKTWTYQKVDDAPDGCGTDFHPAIAVDHKTHKVYVAWYDGRFGPYEGYVALTVCTPASTGPATCTPNEAINDKPFFITTDRNDLTFIGDYFTLHVKPGGDVWAGFGSPGNGQTDGVSNAYLAEGSVP